LQFCDCAAGFYYHSPALQVKEKNPVAPIPPSAENNQVTVPQVCGMNLDDAKRPLEAARLVIDQTQTRALCEGPSDVDVSGTIRWVGRAAQMLTA
jgi:hypothetical protein